MDAETAGVLIGLDELLEANWLKSGEVPLHSLLVDADGYVQADVVDGHVCGYYRQRWTERALEIKQSIVDDGRVVIVEQLNC